ncbi:uncharacterized protein LOC108708665 isoform X2 [Xenopus laevis]|uniref:Uncharacterized protein LOC108708665 isoform X2 n=1 Tax=Xenopus laevis TaxID=8355 RepID=A0A8J1MBS8_XENLA|nr:uncharacterized protein LOC108708665 isoform X2 [Xenopus laevis]
MGERTIAPASVFIITEFPSIQRCNEINTEEKTMIFVTKCPCDECVPLIKGAGIQQIYAWDMDIGKKKADISYMKFGELTGVSKYTVMSLSCHNGVKVHSCSPGDVIMYSCSPGDVIMDRVKVYSCSSDWLILDQTTETKFQKLSKKFEMWKRFKACFSCFCKKQTNKSTKSTDRDEYVVNILEGGEDHCNNTDEQTILETGNTNSQEEKTLTEDLSNTIGQVELEESDEYNCQHENDESSSETGNNIGQECPEEDYLGSDLREEKAEEIVELWQEEEIKETTIETDGKEGWQQVQIRKVVIEVINDQGEKELRILEHREILRMVKIQVNADYNYEAFHYHSSESNMPYDGQWES